MDSSPKQFSRAMKKYHQNKDYIVSFEVPDNRD